MAFNWTCPYCNRAQIVTERNFTWACAPLEESSLGKLCLSIKSTTCADKACRELTMTADLYAWTGGYVGHNASRTGSSLLQWKLRPDSVARPLPDFIPGPLRTDYIEACRICALSPKASATLSRRCLQGMIRDFFGISKKRLIDEITELRKQLDQGTAKERVAPDTIDAIDGVREIGNIGAHMEADINMIVDVDPNEAQTLIELLELLFDEWYIAKQTRLDRLAKVTALAAKKRDEKEQQKQVAGAAQQPALPPPDDPASS